MMPINDRFRKLLIQAVESEHEQLTMEGMIPIADRAREDGEVEALLADYAVIKDALMSNRFVVFDTTPQCMASLKGDGGNGRQCPNKARYAPLVVVFGPDGRTPLCQAETNPPLRLCADHATGNVDHYIQPEMWLQIQEQTVKATGTVIRKEDARIMFLDAESGQMVPPPTVAIARG